MLVYKSFQDMLRCIKSHWLHILEIENSKMGSYYNDVHVAVSVDLVSDLANCARMTVNVGQIVYIRQSSKWYYAI